MKNLVQRVKGAGAFWTSLVLAAVMLVPTACGGQNSRKSGQKADNPPAQLTTEDSPLDRNIRAPISFAPVIKKVVPCVVTIYSTTKVRERMDLNPFLQDPFLRRFFGDSDQMQPREREAQGLGSGVIVSPNGYILTANHVVEGADQVKVALSSGDRQLDAKIIGTDPMTDVAVLKVETDKDLPAAVLADSDKLEVGDMTLAIGNPFGVGQTVTMGIVSALSRGGFGISAYENFIQTDAAINPGNSGGALVDVQGRLIGINTAIMSRSGGFQGVGFAVPINMARGVMDQLIKTGKVTRGYLGISIQPLTSDLAKEFGLPEESSGVLVGDVMPGGSAAKAGLEKGDVIVELNGKKVSDPRALQLFVSQTPPNTKVTVKVLRSEPGSKRASQKTLTAVLDELPRNAFARRGAMGEERSPGQAQLDALDGVEVMDLDAQTRRQFHIPQSVRGALVTNVDPNSNAAEAGLSPSDVILEINREVVHSADEAVEMSNKATGDRILLRVFSSRSNGTKYLLVDNTKH